MIRDTRLPFGIVATAKTAIVSAPALMSRLTAHQMVNFLRYTFSVPPYNLVFRSDFWCYVTSTLRTKRIPDTPGPNDIGRKKKDGVHRFPFRFTQYLKPTTLSHEVSMIYRVSR